MAQKTRRILLIIDDERDVRGLIRAVLENGLREYDLEVITKASSDTALQILKDRNGDIDLVSTNVPRPGMDGYSFIQSVRKRYPHIKILVCSEHIRKRELEELFGGNLIDGYLKKPFGGREYLNAVRNMLERHNIIRPHFS